MLAHPGLLSKATRGNLVQKARVHGYPNTHTFTNLDGLCEGVVLSLHLLSQQLEPVWGKHDRRDTNTTPSGGVHGSIQSQSVTPSMHLVATSSGDSIAKWLYSQCPPTNLAWSCCRAAVCWPSVVWASWSLWSTLCRSAHTASKRSPGTVDAS